MSAKLVVVAACALVDADGRVLIAQRPEGKAMAGLWEFPGGKIEDGEGPEQTLIRELKEELGIEVSEACLAPLTFASHGYPDFHLLMPLLRLPALGGNGHRQGSAAACLGETEPAARLPDAAGGRAASVPSGGALVTQTSGLLKQEVPMRNRLNAQFRRFLHRQEGATAIEYALIAAGIAAAIIITVNALGVSVVAMWTAISNALG